MSTAETALPAIVCLHGFMGREDDWQAFLPLLDSRFDVVNHNLPKPTQWGFDEYIQQLSGWLAHYTAEPCILLGYSMGARLALGLSRLMTTRCAGIILESVNPGLSTEPQKLQRIAHDKQWQDLLRDAEHSGAIQQKREVLTRWYQQGVFADLTDSQRAEQVQRRAQQNLADEAEWFDSTGLGLQPDFRDWIKQMSIPCLMLCGEKDTKFSSLQQQVAALNPVIESQQIENAGHLPHWQQARATAARINSFLQQYYTS